MPARHAPSPPQTPQDVQEELVGAARRWARRYYPLNAPISCWVELLNLGRVKLLIPPSTCTESGGGSDANATRPSVPFRPNSNQKRILEALNGKAMGGKALADLLFRGDKKFLQRPNVMRPLRRLGLVDVDPNVGYYRPDAPPAGIELAEVLDENEEGETN